jgi:hypothetical protein
VSDEGLERLVDSLLWEGYALYPYTPGATKNATPTPFGIVYPPAYAAGAPTTFDHIVLEGRLDGEAEVGAEVRFLAGSGERHQAEGQRIALDGPGERDVRVGGLTVHVRLEVGRFATLRVENRTDAPAGLDRAGALRHALLSTHPLLRAAGGRFVSPLEAGGRCASVNTWPVLATPGDDVLLGAAIVLPDHPQLAPESRGSLFDATEIEEALLLHVQALSGAERAAIERQDPAVRAIVARAAAAGPEELRALHGRVVVRDPDPATREPPQPSAAVRDPSAGEQAAEVDGATFRRGGRVVLRPGPDADVHARMLAGRTATIERIYVAWDGKVHLGVTIDGDPAQELMRETGRLLFFFAPEVEVIA